MMWFGVVAIMDTHLQKKVGKKSDYMLKYYCKSNPNDFCICICIYIREWNVASIRDAKSICR